MQTVSNVYDKIPDSMKQERRTYPNFEKTKIEIPFNGLISGMTGAGKTSLVYDILSKCDCWTFIIICAKNLNEPIYRFMMSKIPKGRGYYCTSLADLPNLDDLDPNLNNLAIIDDQIMSKKTALEAASQYVIRGRKANLTTLFLTQTWFKTPSEIRNNSNYAWIMKSANAKEIKRLLADMPQVDDQNKDQLAHDLTHMEKGQFLLFDLNHNTIRYQ